LRSEIEQAYPYYDMTDPIHPAVDFHGGENWVTFLAPAPQSAASSGRARITISSEREGKQLQLVMHSVPELATSQRSAWAVSLLRNVAAVRFTYLGADGGNWSPHWASTQTMPNLVRVQVAFPHGDGRVWPDLIVAPHIETDVGCVYDYNTKHCASRQ
jgi:general secretion pathway protein J